MRSIPTSLPSYLQEQAYQYRLAKIRRLKANLRSPHEKQREFIDSAAPRKVLRAGRRGGKTTGIAIDAIDKFIGGRRVLYGAPTQEQVDHFWFECKRALAEPLDAGLLYKNESRHIIEFPGSKARLRAKTAWNADTLRGDYADYLIFDEWQLMCEDAWELVGAPMLIDNNGIAVFIYTPRSPNSRSVSKARDPQHAAKMFKAAQADTTGRWAAFSFTSYDNPHVSKQAIDNLALDMTAYAYEMEILAEDKEDSPGALWKRDTLRNNRVNTMPDLTRLVVGVDPPGGAAECGIVVGGTAEVDGLMHGFVIDDCSLRDSPAKWGSAIVAAYNRHRADRVLGEKNYGGDMVENTVRSVEGGKSVSYKDVQATRGKAVRAEPVAALYERGLIHHVGEFPALEDELCTWEPNSGMRSPNRLDALVWIFTELMITDTIIERYESPLAGYRG